MKTFPNRQALADSLARDVSRAVSRVITRKGSAVLAVSGGTTPQRFFESLSREDITWGKVVVTLVDERQVQETSPRSNAAFVKASLLQHRARAATFVPLHENKKTASVLALDVVVLGMGIDGHTASFFPGGDRLGDALDLANREGLVGMNAPGAGEARLTFTLSKLLDASSLFLHIEGQAKIKVLEDARNGSDVSEMPVRAVLNSGKPLSVYWCT